MLPVSNETVLSVVLLVFTSVLASVQGGVGREDSLSQTLDQVPNRCITFVLAVAKYPAIAAALGQRGYGQKEHGFVWDRLTKLGTLPATAPSQGVSDKAVIGIVLVAGGLGLAWRRTGSFRPEAPLSLGGVAIAGLGAVILLQGGSAPSSVLAPGAVAGALLLIAGPWLWRLALERDAERSARIRTEERADVATRVHDSVLQTLALIQRHADEPRRVASLARRQERELRGWLYADQPVGDDTSSLLAEDLPVALPDASSTGNDGYNALLWS